MLSQRRTRVAPYISLPWKFSRVPDYTNGYFSRHFNGLGGWPLGYEERRCLLIVCALSFQDFQPTVCDRVSWCWWSTNVTHGRTDRRTTCNRKTVLCTIVHRAVKQRRNTDIAHIIGIADIVLLSILSIDPACSGRRRLQGHVRTALACDVICKKAKN